MNVLQLTPADLRKMVDDERNDGKQMPKSTLSRQMNGKSRVDPFLALFLRALARERGVSLDGSALAPTAPKRDSAAERRRYTLEALRQAQLLRGQAPQRA